MNGHTFHRGIGFWVKKLGAGRWQWAIELPASVSGLTRKSGEIVGEQADAVEAAKREIEAQDGHAE